MDRTRGMMAKAKRYTNIYISVHSSDQNFNVLRTNAHLYSVKVLYLLVMRRVLCLDDTERTAATYLTPYI